MAHRDQLTGDGEIWIREGVRIDDGLMGIISHPNIDRPYRCVVSNAGIILHLPDLFAVCAHQEHTMTQLGGIRILTAETADKTEETDKTDTAETA